QPGAEFAQASGGVPCRGLDLSFHHRGTWYGLPAAGVPGMAYRGRQMKDSDPGTLTVAATPLGQPADASPRLAAALAAAQLIAAEDTRRGLRLARGLGVRLTRRLVSDYHGVGKGKSAEVPVPPAAPGPTGSRSPARGCPGCAPPATGWSVPPPTRASRCRCCPGRPR